MHFFERKKRKKNFIYGEKGSGSGSAKKTDLGGQKLTRIIKILGNKKKTSVCVSRTFYTKTGT